MGHSADSSELIPQIQTVRMSLRPPSRFTGGTDLILWLKRFEMYVRKVKVDESQWTSELLPLRFNHRMRSVPPVKWEEGRKQ